MSNIRPEEYPAGQLIIHRKDEPISPVSGQLQKEIESIISVIADKKSIPALINLLDDNEYEIRWIAAESLIRIGRKSILPLLRTIRDGKIFIYPGKARHVLQCLLTRSEKRSLHALLASLSGSRVKNGEAVIEASLAIKRVRYVKLN